MSRPGTVRGGFVPKSRFVIMVEALDVSSIVINDTGSSPVNLTISRVALIVILLPSKVLVGRWRVLNVGIRNAECLTRFAIFFRQPTHRCKIDRIQDRLEGPWSSATFSLERVLQVIYVSSAGNQSFVRPKLWSLLGNFKTIGFLISMFSRIGLITPGELERVRKGSVQID